MASIIAYDPQSSFHARPLASGLTSVHCPYTVHLCHVYVRNLNNLWRSDFAVHPVLEYEEKPYIAGPETYINTLDCALADQRRVQGVLG